VGIRFAKRKKGVRAGVEEIGVSSYSVDLRLRKQFPCGVESWRPCATGDWRPSFRMGVRNQRLDQRLKRFSCRCHRFINCFAPNWCARFSEKTTLPESGLSDFPPPRAHRVTELRFGASCPAATPKQMRKKRENHLGQTAKLASPLYAHPLPPEGGGGLASKYNAFLILARFRKNRGSAPRIILLWTPSHS